MTITSRIAGVGTYIPERKITNDDVLKMLKDHSSAYFSNGDLEILLEKAKTKLVKTGNNTRYWCREDQYCTDIAKIASEKALKDADIDPLEIDMIIFTGMSKAFVEPATAHVLRHEIGALNANVIDTQDACTSFMKSIQIANAFIANGTYKNVLVACGERSFDWADFACKTIDELKWKFGSLTIGDAAGAMVVQATEDPMYTEQPKHMDFFYNLTDGTYATCHIGLNYRIGERYHLHSNSYNLIRTGMEAFLELMVDVVNRKEYIGIQYDILFSHDIGRIIEDLIIPNIRAADICVPENYKSFFDQYGNTGSVSLPLQLDMAKQDGRLQRGNLAAYICPAAGVQAGLMLFVY